MANENSRRTEGSNSRTSSQRTRSGSTTSTRSSANSSKTTVSSRSGASSSAKKSSSSTQRAAAKSENTGLYVFVSAVFNLVFGLMGLGIGFLFFLASALTSGAMLYSVLIFICGAIAIAMYLFCLYKINQAWVNVCSDKKNTELDKTRMIGSMVYAVFILAIAFAYSFLKSAIS
ncbi:MAG: hypothetical protein K5656_11630 [Lachnospiraceae bacterium]|nr:hypothetical protein [Lachnospiraceae bacterium]